MIQLYTWGTPNGKKVSIMLEEIAMPYEFHPINIGQGRPVPAGTAGTLLTSWTNCGS